MIFSGSVIGWSGKQVTVRLSNGRTVTANANGRRYKGIGSRVYVAIDPKSGKASLI